MIFLEWTEFEHITPKHIKVFRDYQDRDTIYRCIRWCENNTSPGKFSYTFDQESSPSIFKLGFEYQADHIMFEIFYKQLSK